MAMDSNCGGLGAGSSLVGDDCLDPDDDAAPTGNVSEIPVHGAIAGCADAQDLPELCLDYTEEAFAAESRTIMGRQAAGAAFLAAYLKHSGRKTITGFVRTEGEGRAFSRSVKGRGGKLRADSTTLRDLRPVERAGTLFCFHPDLEEHAWRRRTGGNRDFSLCGITHAMSSQGAMRAVTQMLMAPVYPWDALICTSTAIRDVVTRLIEAQAAYVEERFGTAPAHAPQLPVIPLGVDAEAFRISHSRRAEARRKLGIGKDELAILYVGRLSAHAKANPIPMLMALGQAAARCPGRKLHMLFAGWFAGEFQQRLFTEAAVRLCPQVKLHLIDGTRGATRGAAWAAGDIFFQLADNIQESFGSAPVEAMAAGMPVVLSDWDGFRDSVTHGVQGFLVRTMMPQAGHGADIAMSHSGGLIDYDLYVGAVSQFCMVSIEEAAGYLVRLIGDPQLRARMGAAGQQRVAERLDWRHVIGRYQELWAELGERRQSARASHWPAGTARPDRMDPFHLFASFPTNLGRVETPVRLPTDASLPDPGVLELKGARIVPAVLPGEDEIAAIRSALAAGAATLGELIETFPTERRRAILRGVHWLAKFGLVDLG